MVVRQIRITGDALKRWFIAQCIDSLCVAAMWLVGLLILRVPWAPFWALLAMAFQFIPHIGGVLTLIGPMFASLISRHRGWEEMAFLLGLYALIVVVDGLVIQPLLLKRTVRVPIWASILVPLVMGFFFQFWGVLLSAPMLAVFFALRRDHHEQRQLPPVEVIPPDEIASRRSRGEQPPVIEG